MIDNDHATDEILTRLDRIIAILHLAFKEQIDAARQEVLADPIVAAILETAAGRWIEAGELKSRVAQETKQSERTVSRRLAGLVAQRALDQDGAGPRTRYKASGVL